MEELVTAFLWLARDPDLPRPMVECDLWTVVEAVVDWSGRARAAVGQDPGRFEVSGDETVAVRGEPLLLEVVVRNVIDNAVRFSAPDRTVSIELRRPGGLEVRNAIGEGECVGACDASYGFGHQIAAELCARLGWLLSTRFEADTHVARIEFTKS